MFDTASSSSSDEKEHVRMSSPAKSSREVNAGFVNQFDSSQAALIAAAEEHGKENPARGLFSRGKEINSIRLRPPVPLSVSPRRQGTSAQLARLPLSPVAPDLCPPSAQPSARPSIFSPRVMQGQSIPRLGRGVLRRLPSFDSPTSSPPAAIHALLLPQSALPATGLDVGGFAEDDTRNISLWLPGIGPPPASLSAPELDPKPPLVEAMSVKTERKQPHHFTREDTAALVVGDAPKKEQVKEERKERKKGRAKKRRREATSDAEPFALKAKPKRTKREQEDIDRIVRIQQKRKADLAALDAAKPKYVLNLLLLIVTIETADTKTCLVVDLRAVESRSILIAMAALLTSTMRLFEARRSGRTCTPIPVNVVNL